MTILHTRWWQREGFCQAGGREQVGNAVACSCQDGPDLEAAGHLHIGRFGRLIAELASLLHDLTQAPCPPDRVLIRAGPAQNSLQRIVSVYNVVQD